MESSPEANTALPTSLVQSKPVVQDAPSNSCNLGFHQFSDTILSTVVYFHVLKMKDSFFLWVGTSKAELNQLAISIVDRQRSRVSETSSDCDELRPARVSATTLLGDVADLRSQNLATRLARRTNKQVLVSCNLQSPLDHGNFMALVEKRLCEEMRTFPEKF